ncbi:hypothetical protein [Tsukamurella sp. 1534]|uniref:hypothetical protein n=1 Tax=Tsukamurella sp. 1534 TaxID=1151061 RepID=UPI0002EC3D29|nr:hypothetical protein [Tsukamurella sp. 1534]
MRRVVIGRRSSRWWWVWAAALVFLAVGNVVDEQWSMLLLWPALACVGGMEYGRSLRERDALMMAGIVIATVAVVFGLVRQDWPTVSVGALLAVGLAVFQPVIRHAVPTCRVRTEELVGRTVADVWRLLGFADRRQPRALAEPVLIGLPKGEQDLGDATLIVTAVAVSVTSQVGDEVKGAVITLGVADSDDPAIPQGDSRVTADLTKSEMQDRLVAEVGGGPADIRPERFPGSAA